MNMITAILITLAILLLLAFVVVAMQPSDFCIKRSITIAARPAVVFGEVDDLHKWKAWSPWEKLDPASKSSYSGPLSGVGASMAWSGNNHVGEGVMTIAESDPDSRIKLKLDFLRPFKATNHAEFTFAPAGPQTIVIWSMTGKNNFVFKAFGLLMNTDKMVGGQFEKGLADLKAVSEVVPGS